MKTIFGNQLGAGEYLALFIVSGRLARGIDAKENRSEHASSNGIEKEVRPGLWEMLMNFEEA